MTGYDAARYFGDLINMIGWTINFLFQVPLFLWGNYSVTIGSLLLYGSIVYVLLRFAINLPGAGITTERRIRIKRDE